jgi:hypothetical protein
LCFVEEERRLLFVTFTRAKKNLYLLAPKSLQLHLLKTETHEWLQHNEERENEMNALRELANRLASMVIGTALALVGLIFIALGITFLPVIGLLIAIPVMWMSFNFLNPKLGVDTVTEGVKEAHEENALFFPSFQLCPADQEVNESRQERDPYCTWPPVSI